MHRYDFSIVEHMKKFSFWGDLLIFWVVLPAGAFLVPMPWDIIVMCIGGLVAGSIQESKSEGLHQTPYSTSYRKLTWYFAILCFLGATVVAFWAVKRYPEDRLMGLWFSYAAARAMAIVLMFVRQLANPVILPEDLPPHPPESLGRPAPITPKSPTMDGSGTLTIERN